MSQCADILRVLSDHRPHRMEEIHQRVGFCRLNSRVAELRSRGHDIRCDKTGGVYVYRLYEPNALGRGGMPAEGTDYPPAGVERRPQQARPTITDLLERHGFSEVIDGQLALEVA